MNAVVQQLDQIINVFAPLSVGQVMTWASHVIGYGFIPGWNLVSLLVEFLFLSRVNQLVPQLAVKPQQQRGGHFQERWQEAVNLQGKINSEAAIVLYFSFMSVFHFFFSELVSDYNLHILSANVPINSEKMRRFQLCHWSYSSYGWSHWWGQVGTSCAVTQVVHCPIPGALFRETLMWVAFPWDCAVFNLYNLFHGPGGKFLLLLSHHPPP